MPFALCLACALRLMPWLWRVADSASAPRESAFMQAPASRACINNRVPSPPGPQDAPAMAAAQLPTPSGRTQRHARPAGLPSAAGTFRQHPAWQRAPAKKRMILVLCSSEDGIGDLVQGRILTLKHLHVLNARAGVVQNGNMLTAHNDVCTYNSIFYKRARWACM